VNLRLWFCSRRNGFGHGLFSVYKAPASRLRQGI
jgi:hypothetical protein